MAFHHVHPISTHFDNDLKMAHATTSYHSWSNLYNPPFVFSHKIPNISYHNPWL